MSECESGVAHLEPVLGMQSRRSDVRSCPRPPHESTTRARVGPVPQPLPRRRADGVRPSPAPERPVRVALRRIRHRSPVASGLARLAPSKRRR